MGLFIANCDNYRDGGIAPKNLTPQGVDNVSSTIITASNCIFGLLTNIVDGQGSGGEGDADDVVKVSKKVQKQIDELNIKIDAKLKEAGVSSLADFSTKIADSQKEQKTIASNIEKTNIDIKVFQNVIDDYPSKKSSLDSQLKQTTDPKQIADIQSSLATLEKEKTNAENQIQALNKQLQEQQKNLEAEKLKEVELTTAKGEVENYQHMIDELKKELPKEITYDVKKESSDIANFNDALSKFKANPCQETASALTIAYKADEHKIDNKTVQKAYEMLVKQYPQFFKKNVD